MNAAGGAGSHRAGRRTADLRTTDGDSAFDPAFDPGAPASRRLAQRRLRRGRGK
ncbi:MAG: hypothetical protein ABJB33_04705 [Gemmatimonadota bacterium]